MTHPSPSADAMRLPAAELARLETRFPARDVPVGEGAVVSVRECGTGPVLVCLHGIGSGAASWLDTALALEADARVIAWDAPGYGRSTPLAPAAPKATDFARRLHALLDALQIECCVLVGHSLGALMAAAAAQHAMPGSARIARLVLISPARGYGAADRAAQGDRVRSERLGTLAQIGIAGMAAGRAGRLLSDGASETARQWVRWNMGQLHDHGYRQAVELLCGDDLLGNGQPAAPCEVHCGEDDGITTPESCGAIARQLGASFSSIPGAGHASPIEQPEVVAGRIGHAQRLSLEGTANG